MNVLIMFNSLENCFGLQQNKSILILVYYGSHCTNDLVTKIRSLNTDLFLLPPRTTHYTQPLDVGVYAPFKRVMREQREQRFPSSIPIFTKKENRKSPTYQDVVGFISHSLNLINCKIISNSFTSCGINENGRYVSSMNLNKRLQSSVNNDNEEELSLSLELDNAVQNIATIFSFY